MNNNIISNCPLCGQHSLHVMGSGESQTQQCISCGYATTDRFLGTREDNEIYKTLPEEMQSWSVENNGRIWIPSMITLPFGTIYPINIDGEMKWAVAQMISIPEDEQKNYPVEGQEGKFHNQRYDTENQTIYDLFLNAMAEMNEKARQENVPESKINLPKLKKNDG